MPRVTGRRSRSRAAALLAGGAFALHQLRYLLGYGHHSHGELARQGHAYMTLLAPLVAVVLMLVVADFCARMLGARAARHPGRAPRLGQVWAAFTLCLLAAYVAQETLEGALAAGHPAGAAALLGHGGWVALPLAAAIGLAVAVLVLGVQQALELGRERPVPVIAPPPVLSVGSAHVGHRPGGRGIARHLGGRAPPLGSIP
jgi:hypothetical protein